MERISEIINRLQRGEPKLSQAAWSRKWGVSEGKLAAMRGDSGRLYADIVARECEEQGLDANDVLLGRPAADVQRLQREIEALKQAHEIEVQAIREQLQDTQATVRTLRRALDLLEDAAEQRRAGGIGSSGASARNVSAVTGQKPKK